MIVQVYRNLRTGGYSVRCAQTRRVIAHVPVILLEDPTFKVSQKGRERVRRTRQKNVHAYIQGEWRNNASTYRDSVEAQWLAKRICRTYVTYNPYGQVPGFHIGGTHTIVQRAAVALLTKEGCHVADATGMD